MGKAFPTSWSLGRYCSVPDIREVLGVRLPSAPLQTGDADFAQHCSVASLADGSLPPILYILRDVDSTFGKSLIDRTRRK
ncbi:GSU2403 family nucleotidyltransferase fold protein [Pseudaminobacter soli (ex Li et al. 2025)]|uniref:GSU2403 family nucleotidyltransferase fold protein n=1 Tax=Pseudaminobacter soli (ex Li et al. 2025) TaxID=1295366 RepID=UPI001FE0A923|nr:GSU2403 family nucleotidyltransferase fold protein [Mesorhizobium soli]